MATVSQVFLHLLGESSAVERPGRHLMIVVELVQEQSDWFLCAEADHHNAERADDHVGDIEVGRHGQFGEVIQAGVEATETDAAEPHMRQTQLDGGPALILGQVRQRDQRQ